MIEALKYTTLLVKSVTKYDFFYDFEKKIMLTKTVFIWP